MAGISVGRSSLPTPGEGQVLFTGGEQIQGEEGAAPVEAVTSPALEVQEPEPLDPVEFFNRRSPLAKEAEGNPMTQNVQNAYWDAFVRGHRKQQFSNLQDYVDWATKLKGRAGEDLAVEEILPFMQQQMVKYMPPHIQQEYQAIQQERAQESAWQKQLQRLKDFNDDPDHKARGLFMGPDGKIKNVDPNKDFDRKHKMFESLREQLNTLDEKLQPNPLDYATEVEDKTKKREAGLRHPEYIRRMAVYRKERDGIKNQMWHIMGLAADEDSAIGQGAPGASSSPQGMTAVNKTTGERIQSLDGGRTWQPID